MNKKRILIVGGAGSIGAELCRQLAPKNKIFVLDNNESGVFDICEELKRYWVKPRVGDIRDKETIKDLFEDFKPQIVINAAALKHVPLSHIYPRDYIDTNIIGNLNLIEEAKRWECLEKFIYISTDKAVNSNNIMGCTKRASEIIVRCQGKGFCAVRFGNVIGSRGSLYTIWERQIKNGEPITITDKRMERYFMTIKEACELVIKAGEESEGGETFILDMGEKKNIYELAKAYKHPIKIIGIREGETFSEELMFEEEKKRAIKKGKFFIIK
jgi:FlaA1/EpsC-like NDP-sugar epimerase